MLYSMVCAAIAVSLLTSQKNLATYLGHYQSSRRLKKLLPQLNNPMSGVSRIVLAENKGLAPVTNEDLREEGVGSAAADAQEDKNNGEDK